MCLYVHVLYILYTVHMHQIYSPYVRLLYIVQVTYIWTVQFLLIRYVFRYLYEKVPEAEVHIYDLYAV